MILGQTLGDARRIQPTHTAPRSHGEASVVEARFARRTTALDVAYNVGGGCGGRGPQLERQVVMETLGGRLLSPIIPYRAISCGARACVLPAARCQRRRRGSGRLARCRRRTTLALVPAMVQSVEGSLRSQRCRPSITPPSVADFTSPSWHLVLRTHFLPQFLRFSPSPLRRVSSTFHARLVPSWAPHVL